LFLRCVLKFVVLVKVSCEVVTCSAELNQAIALGNSQNYRETSQISGRIGVGYGKMCVSWCYYRV